MKQRDWKFKKVNNLDKEIAVFHFSIEIIWIVFINSIKFTAYL